jgi:hypothetical protein
MAETWLVSLFRTEAQHRAIPFKLNVSWSPAKSKKLTMFQKEKQENKF